jgi:hypothetical protein
LAVEVRFKFELRVVVDERIALAMVGVDDDEDDGGGCRGGTISPPPASVLCILVVDNDDEVAMDDANLAWILSLCCCCCRLCEVRCWLWWYRFVNPENGNRRLLPPLPAALPRALPFFPKGLFRTDSRNDLIAEDGIFSTPLSWACCRPRIPMVINHTIVPPMASNNAKQV